MQASYSVQKPFVGAALFAAGLIASYYVTVGAAALANMGYNWGYHLVEHMVGQPQSDQFIGACVLSGVFVPAIAAGFSLTYFESALGKNWHSAILLPFFICGCAFIQNGMPSQWSDVVSCLPYLLGALIPAYASRFIAKKIYPELAMRINAKRFLACIAFTLWAAYSLRSIHWDDKWLLQCFTYCAFMFCTAATAAILARAKTASAGFTAGFFVSLPVTVADIANVVLNVGCLSLNTFGMGWQLGWRALLSALIITICSIVLSGLGGVCGSLIVKACGEKCERAIV
jgi:hypothetical protein